MPYNIVLCIFFSIISIVPLHPPYDIIVYKAKCQTKAPELSKGLYNVGIMKEKLETIVLAYMKVFWDYMRVMSSPRYLLSGLVMA